jgi:hypothetical protein
MYHWYYIWSPKYEIFHQILSSTLVDASGIILHPIFAKQSYFTPTSKDGHFFSGLTIKQFVIEKALREHKGEHIIVSDADLIILQKDKIAEYLKEYEQNEITCMKDTVDTDTYNMGFMFLKSTESTADFFSKITRRIKEENGHDQMILNEELPSFPGSHGLFSLPEFVQSNMNEEIIHETILIQCLCTVGATSDHILVEKLFSISLLFDISGFKQYIPNSVLSILIKYTQEFDPLNYISAWELCHTETK